MRDGVYTRFTKHCAKCGEELPYSLPVEADGPLCTECAAKEPKKEEPKPSPIGVPF